MIKKAMIAMEQDFTEKAYKELLTKVNLRFTISSVFEALEKAGSKANLDGIAAWRHDVDFSPHRALALAKLEAEQGVSSTYFILLSSPFYNPLERDTAGLVRQIRHLGHEIGLHFDASIEVEDPVHQLQAEAVLLSSITGSPVRIFSLHNPSVSSPKIFDSPFAGGLMNATCGELREQFTYSSDSNGIWRFRSLHEVVADDHVQCLYALTHPEWWTPTPMSPAAKITRCIKGRAQAVARDYVRLISKHRPEVLPYVR